MLHVWLRRGQAALRATLVALAIGATTLQVPASAQAQSAGAVAEQAASLAAAGRHLEAASRYEQAAKPGFLAPWDARYALLAAREYVAAGEFAEAERLLDKVRTRARTDEERALLAVVVGGLALDRGDARAALGPLRAAPMSVPTDLAIDVLDLRGRAEIASGETLAGVRTFEARGGLLADEAARRDNDRRLFDQLLLHPPAAVPAVPGMSERERGWLELPGIVAGASVPSSPAAFRVRDWLAQHPGHPGAAFLPRVGTAVLTAPMSGDASIALLLPMSGKQQAAATAVRDGFTAAWFASGSGETRTRVDVYDTATGVAAAYQRAISDGASVVVGPLLKDEVLALVAAQPAGLPVPTLALNSAIAEGSPVPTFLFQFALDPEQEARAVARRIVEDGLTRGIGLFPEGAWGRRVHAAFVDELTRLGSVALTSAQFYPPEARDFSAPLRAALGRFGGAGDRPADRSRPRPSRNAAAEQAAGPQFAFLAATPATARAIRPQLRFQMTYDLPVYATSDAWEPGARAVADLEGLVFPEMPWLLYGGQGAPELWDATQGEWSTRVRGRLRLCAFGYDAFRLAQQLGRGPGVAGLDGLTGTLEIQRGDGHVRRGLQFARVTNGRPVPAPPGPTSAFPVTPPANPGGTGMPR